MLTGPSTLRFSSADLPGRERATVLREVFGRGICNKEAYLQEVLLGRQLELATRVITARVPVVAVKAALGGFDTAAEAGFSVTV